jgi:hypothetical protein
MHGIPTMSIRARTRSDPHFPVELTRFEHARMLAASRQLAERHDRGDRSSLERRPLMAFGGGPSAHSTATGGRQPAASAWETFHDCARTVTTTPTAVTWTECAGHAEATSRKA